MNTVTKSYKDLPAAHRQPNHNGHCRLIHGHNWSFDITFACEELDENGFVIDVGKLQELKSFLKLNFDHTLLLNAEDPCLDAIKAALGDSFARIVVVPNCGMEGLARYVFEEVQRMIDKGHFEEAFDRGLFVMNVVCWEDSKNSAAWIK